MLLKKGGLVVLDAAFDAFADASGTSAPCEIMSVAAFLFEKGKSAQLDLEWRQLLEPFLNHLPPEKRVFRMSTFMAHQRPYDKLNDAEWLSLRRRLIESVSGTLEFAVVSSVSAEGYKKMLPIGDNNPNLNQRITRKDILGGPFTMCGIWTMRSLASYIGRKNRAGDIVFFFEAGDPDQQELCARINDIARSPLLSSRYRYGGHSFVPKQCHHALGAADMMAWEYRIGIEEHLRSGSFHPGPFFLQLFDMPVGAMHFSPVNVQIQTMVMVVEESNRWAEERDFDE